MPKVFKAPEAVFKKHDLQDRKFFNYAYYEWLFKDAEIINEFHYLSGAGDPATEAIYTVPQGKTLFLIHAHFHYYDTGSASQGTGSGIEIPQDNYYLIRIYGHASYTQSVTKVYSHPLRIISGRVINLRRDAVHANKEVVGEIVGFLVNNDNLRE